MLIKENSLRTEWIYGKQNRFRVYIFKCLTCDNEIRSRNSYFKKHSGLCIQCSSKITIKKAQQSNRLKPYESRYNILKVKCPDTTITYDDYLEFVGKDCHYCERYMNWKPFDNNPGFWLDRKDSNLGHVKGNLVVCCGLCNFTKTDRYTYEEFMLLAPTLKLIREKRK